MLSLVKQGGVISFPDVIAATALTYRKLVTKNRRIEGIEIETY